MRLLHRIDELDEACAGGSCVTIGVFDAIHAEKGKRQPLDLPSAGCVFRNPAPGVSAGRLVDACGLRGARRGGAQVSEKHADLIVRVVFTGEGQAMGQ